MVSNYGIGGNEVKLDVNEEIVEIPQNKTLIAQKLTEDAPVTPEIVSGLKNINEVFEHFKPEITVDFESKEGGALIEDFKFKGLYDFTLKGILAQSQYLGDLNTEMDQYQKIIKMLKTNRILKSAIEDPEAKDALLGTLKSLISELEEAK